MILSDTDCIIDYLNGKAPEDGPLARALVDGTLAISPVVAFELYYGHPSGPRRADLDELLTVITILPLTRAAAEIAGLEGARLQAAGTKLPAPDLLIAGTALDRDLPLLTRNIRHFERIRGLRLEQPD